ncbi:FecR family protein [Sphingomonas sp. SORGH_AS_0879]|uniref:FecR family protein n=1 Tax=Sphingomonas sp. SORGH_AS_0879 TaxID=3041790 RepID=UPI00277F39F9|nr:DUF4880 domain-containing protein [Sphingomonas sp. SORGH_AS_0879]MDQ1231760.1 transmembrane sensor [Sphingomonas sp. SORGH_AS_0879]
MSSHCPRQPCDADLTDEAAAWLAALDAGSADIAAFEAWRDADVRRAVAFVEVASTWRDLDRLRVARGDMQHAPELRPLAKPEHPDRRHVLRAAASVAAVMVVGGGFAYRANARDKAVTKVGERTAVAAGPGLSLHLNTDSCVYWKDGAPDRLWLERGEVAIRLDASHRLELIAPDGRFQLSPGLYNARLRPTGCELAVVRGRIVDGTKTSIGPGEVALATAGRLTIHSRDGSDMARVTAWQRDTLVLNGESLDYALAEMNRYLADKIVIGDPALSRLRIGGTFATTNPREFLQALRTSFGVRATSGANGGIVLSRA